MRTDYTVELVESSRELTVRERLRYKDFSLATSIDEATTDMPLIIDFDSYAIFKVHNERSDNKDYIKIVVADMSGVLYVTGSKSFIESLKEILEEMEGLDEMFSIEVYRRESKNYKGKSFIKCSIV